MYLPMKQMKNSEKRLGIKINSKLTFEDQIGRICIKSQCRAKCFDQTTRLNES